MVNEQYKSDNEKYNTENDDYISIQGGSAEDNYVK